MHVGAVNHSWMYMLSQTQMGRGQGCQTQVLDVSLLQHTWFRSNGSLVHIYLYLYRYKCSKGGGEVENDRAKILWAFQMHTGEMVKANQRDTVVGDKQKKLIVMDVAIPSDSNI